MDLGLLLRAARADSGRSQVEVARLVGVTRQALSRWENGSRPVRSDDADRVLAACGRDVRFSLVLRHTDLDELLAQLAATSELDRVRRASDVLMPQVLHDLQATGGVRFSGAWAAAALGLPALHRTGGVEVSEEPAAQAQVAAVLRPWNPVMVKDGQLWAASWDDQVFRRNPAATWSAAVLGDVRIEVAVDGLEQRVLVDGRSWRVVDPQQLVPDVVDATTLERWRRPAT